jgi:hypothetical protein
VSNVRTKTTAQIARAHRYAAMRAPAVRHLALHALLAMAVAAAAAAAAAPASAATSVEDGLLAWMRSRGADLGADIRQAAGGRPRGVYAARDHEGAC